MSLDILKSELKKGIIRRLYLFYGPEEYLKKYYLNTIEKSLVGDEFKDFNLIVLEGKVDYNRIIEACETLPVFSPKKLVVARNTGIFSSKPSGNEAMLSEYLSSIPEHACLIFYEEAIEKKPKILERVAEHGLVVEFPYQNLNSLRNWIINICKSGNKEIDRASAEWIAENCGYNMTEIYNEVKKIIAYVGDRAKITRKDIDEICSKSIHVRIFDLTDAIGEKNVSLALKHLNDMITLKEPIPYIFFMIVQHFRNMLSVKLLEKERLTSGEIASRLGIKPYVVSVASKQAKKFTAERLKKALEDIHELDVSIKTGLIEDRTALELFIAGFAGENN